MKLTSASDLVDKSIVCPKCSKPATLRKDDEGYWVDCKGDHRPVVNVLDMTSLEVPEHREHRHHEAKEKP